MSEDTGPWKTALGWMVVGLIVLAMLHYGGVIGREKTDAETRQAQKENWRREMIAAAMVGVRARLRDPSSADFGEVFVSEKSGKAVCGMINAKNGFGGYTGMRPFVITLSNDTSQGHTWMNDADAWNKHCAGVAH